MVGVYEDVGIRLKQLRGDRTLDEVEALSTVPGSTINRAENGKNAPPLKLLKFYRSEGASIDYILFGVEQDSGYATALLIGLSLCREDRIRLAAALLNPGISEAAEPAQ